MSQLDVNFQTLLNDLPIILSDTMFELGLDAKALIQQRIQEKGLNAKGGKTPDYSESYALYRKKKGRQTSYMDATFTGEMWRSTGIVNKEQDDKQTKVTVAGRDQFTQVKIDNLSKTQFEILALADEEETILEGNFNQKFGDKSIEILSRGL